MPRVIRVSCPAPIRVLLQALLLAAAGSANALPLPQAGGELAGQVLAQDGTPLAGVRISLIATEGNSTLAIPPTATDPAGKFTLKGIPPGRYRLRAAKPGYVAIRSDPVTLHSGEQTSLNIKLPLLTQPSTAGKPGSGGSSQDDDLFHVQLYEKPQLQTGRLANPSAGAGYSDSATVESSRMIHEYLQTDNSPDSGGAKSAELRVDCTAPMAAGLPDLSGEVAYRDRGKQLLACKQFPAAVSLFTQALRDYPQSEPLQVGLGIALYSSGKFDDAVRALVAASDRNPASPTPYQFLARAYQLSHAAAPEAVARLQRFATLQPDNAEAQYDYALALWKNRTRSASTVAQVEALLKRVIQLSPNDARAHLHLGEVYALQSRWQQAVRELELATRLQPSLAQAHYQLALAYSRSGQKEKGAREMALYQQLHASQPSN